MPKFGQKLVENRPIFGLKKAPGLSGFLDWALGGPGGRAFNARPEARPITTSNLFMTDNKTQEINDDSKPAEMIRPYIALFFKSK